MRLLLRNVLVKLGHIFLFVSRIIYESPQEKRFNSWFIDQGDKTLRLDYNLSEESLVFDLGGYEGQWASDIFAMYGCSIHIFEPVIEFADRIERRFSKNRKVIVHKFGLSNGNNKTQISVNRDSSSIFKSGKDVRDVTMIDITDFFRENNVKRVDLLKINIEGGEYDLLEHLIDTGLIRYIDNIQVQFHDFMPDADLRMRRIQSQLEKTHVLTYQYLFVWENWKSRQG